MVNRQNKNQVCLPAYAFYLHFCEFCELRGGLGLSRARGSCPTCLLLNPVLRIHYACLL